MANWQEKANKGKDLEKITLSFKDGTARKIDHGFICEVKMGDEKAELKFDMCRISGEEIELIVMGMLELGIKLGILPDNMQGKADAMEMEAERPFS